MESKQNDPALAKLREAALDADTGPEDRRAAAELLAEAGAIADAIPALIGAGRDLMDSGDVAEARACFVRAFELDPKNYDALFEVGRADLADGRREDALAKFVEVLRKTNLRHMPALFETGCLYELLGKYDEAILAFKRIVERDKTHVDGLEHLARVHQAKNLKPDAVNYYNLAADAGFAAERFGDARRCANAALALDPDNAKAKAMQANLKNIATAEPPKAAPKPQPKPAPVEAARPQPQAAPAAQAAPSQQAAPPPQAASPPQATPAPPPAPVAAPPPPASSSPLSTEVFLLEQQSEAMTRLARAQTEVAQTYKRRLAVEEEIKSAKAALESLERERTNVETSLSELKAQIEAASKAKAAEDAVLAQLAASIQKVREELGALASLPTDIEAIKSKCAAVSGQVAKANEALTASQARAEKVLADTGAVETSVKELQSKFAAARQGADAVENQLVGLLEQTRGVHATAKGAVGQVAEMKTAIASLEALGAQLEASRTQLESESKRVAAKQAETSAALQRVETIRAARATAGAASASAPAPSATPPAASVPAPAPASDTLKNTNGMSRGAAPADSASSLLAEGDALRAAKNSAAAYEKYKAAIAIDGANSGARYRMGLALADLGKVDDSLSALKPLEADKEYGVLAQTAMANALRARGDVDGAEGRLSKALEATGYPEEHYRHALYALAGLHESKGDPDSLGLALWSYEEIVAGDPAYADVAKRIEKIKAALAAPSARNGAK
jgi:tetratricopeptide (TPR) repeat protein